MLSYIIAGVNIPRPSVRLPMKRGNIQSMVALIQTWTGSGENLGAMGIHSLPFNIFSASKGDFQVCYVVMVRELLKHLLQVRAALAIFLPGAGNAEDSMLPGVIA